MVATYWRTTILNSKFIIQNNFMITVSTDKSKLDVPYLQNFLKDIYWAAGRTMDEVQTTIDASFCFGIYLDDQQIGFARVITDYVVFAYLMDVFIDEKHRGKGYSSILIEAMMKEPQLQQVKIWRLATSDAHFLYSKFGFSALAHPEKMMEKII
jgi:GNAT superfamily N-acetyltransferase